ncbi:MAG: hypothetical protein M3O82_10030 [Verrucomicrobiota bacterium]|nr:hypothetical protein [Verrucomicrobiota bacterium]
MAHDIDLGQPAIFTPYDSAMAPVRQVLARAHNQQPTFAKVTALMKRAHLIRYGQTTGDCKTKSLWLCERIGDPDLRFVVGKLYRRSRQDHAWLLWKHDGRWWILDPANARRPLAADVARSDKYVPYYTYARTGDYRHHATSLLIASNTTPR